MSSTRTANRNTDKPKDPQVQLLWDECKKGLDRDAELEKEITTKSARLLALEQSWADRGLTTPDKPGPDIPIEELTEDIQLYADLSELEEERYTLHAGEDGEDGVEAKLKILYALQKAREEEEERNQSNTRVPNTRGANLANLDGAGESAASSPLPDAKPRPARPQKPSSQPPKETKEALAKRDDSEAPDIPTKTGKVVFTLGTEVAFKPKASAAEETDWIQGTVVKVIGEGKSRRYDVQDPEPDEKTGKQAIIRTWASSMVTIPPLGAPLPEYPVGKHVLARYPDTTTFYRAEVAGNAGSDVMLKFEGEEDKDRVLNVDRRFVLDHRG